MSIHVHKENQYTHKRRLELNNSTDDLDMHEYVRVRRVHVVEIDGERFSRQDLKRALRAAKRCKCGECLDCEVALACKKSGWK
jgi:hypothetical protein